MKAHLKNTTAPASEANKPLPQRPTHHQATWTPHAADQPMRLALRVSDACDALGIGQTSFWKLVKEGKLRPTKIAGRVVVPVAQLHALLAASDAA